MSNLQIKVVEARSLKSADANGFSDPFCTISVGRLAKPRTKVHKKTLNPTFNEQFSFEGVAPSDAIVIEVWDWDRVGKADFLGSFTLQHSELPLKKNKEGWFPLGGPAKDCITGDIHLVFYRTDEKVSKDLAVELVSEGSGQLFVEVLEGRDLAAKDLSGTSDPFVKLAFATARWQTEVCHKNLNPKWEAAEFYCEVKDESEKLQVHIFDHDKFGSNESMGTFSLTISEIRATHGESRWFTLQPSKREKVSGELLLRVSFLSARQAQRNYKIAEQRASELTEILFTADSIVMCALCKAYSNSDLDRAIMRVHEANEQAHRFLNQILFREICSTAEDRSSTLFRTDSPATKATLSYFKLVAGDYLRNLLGTHCLGIINEPSGYEVDPPKVPANETLAANVAKVERAVNVFFEAIVGSVSACPLSMRKVLHYMREMVAQRFPQMTNTSVGAFYFLRFVGPAIFTPEGFGIIKTPPDSTQRRGLILVSKIIQKLANGVEFRDNETYLMPFNAFIRASVPRLQAFLEELASPPTLELRPTELSLTMEERTQDLAVIVRHLSDNLDRMEPMLPQDLRVQLHPEKLQVAKRQLSQLRGILL